MLCQGVPGSPAALWRPTVRIGVGRVASNRAPGAGLLAGGGGRGGLPGRRAARAPVVNGGAGTGVGVRRVPHLNQTQAVPMALRPARAGGEGADAGAGSPRRLLVAKTCQGIVGTG